MVQLLNSIYLGAATPSDYGKAAGVVELLPFDYYLGAAVPSHGIPTVNVLLSGVSPLTLLNAISLNYVKAFGKCEQRNLPKGYKQLEYIVFDSTQVLDTGFTPNNNSRIESKCYRTGTNCWFYGASPNNPRVTLFHSDSGTSRWGNQSRLNLGFVADTEYTIIEDKNGLTINGILYPWDTGSAGDFTCDRSLTIGNNNGSTGTRYFAGNFYYMKIYDNDVLVRDYVPVKRISDNSLGIYDRVNSTFLTASGFVAGAEVVPTPDYPMDIVCNNGAIKVKDDELPVGYKRLLDVYFDGDSYFETGEKLIGSDVVTMTLQPDSSAGQNVFGAYSGSGSSAVNFSLYVYAANGSRSFYRYNQTLLRPTLGTGKRTISFGNGSTSGFYNNVTYDVEEFETTDTAQIGALPNSSSPKFTGYLYGNVTIGNRLKYIPCERVSDSAIGYYETVNGEFLENQGTGTLTTSGYDTSHLTEIYIDGTVETVTVIPNEREKYFVQYINAYLRSSTRSIAAYSGNSVVTFDCEVGKTYCCINRAMSGQSISVNIGYSDTIPTVGYVYAQDDFVSTSIVDGYYKTTGLVFTAKKRYATFIFRYDGDSSQTPTSMLEQMIFYEVAKKGTATCQPLLSVGDYKDVQNITNGAITRNVGVKVFDGTEDWEAHTAVGTYRYRLEGKLLEKSLFYSTHFVYSSATSTGLTDGEMMCGAATSNIYVCKTDMTTLDSFKAWLASQYAAGTPVIVVYPLKNPTTETVTGQTLTITQGTNVVTAEGSVSDLELEVSYKGYAELTVEEIEAVNTDESVDVIIS